MRDLDLDTGNQEDRQGTKESEETAKAIRFYRKVNKAVESGENVEVKKDKDGRLKVLQVSKKLI